MRRYSRSRQRSDGPSRRKVLAGGLLVAGGGALTLEAGAFSQLEALREATVGTAADEDALLGVELAPLVQAGVDGQALGTITNNAEEPLAPSATLVAREGGEDVYLDTGDDLDPGESADVTVDVAADRVFGDGSLDVSFDGEGDGISVDLTRSVPVPTLTWSVDNLSDTSGVSFMLGYEIEPEEVIEEVAIVVDNLANDDVSESYGSEPPSGVLEYPGDGATDDGGQGDTYGITFEASDQDGQEILDRTEEFTAGEEPGDGDLGNEDDPEFEWMYVVDDSSSEHGVDFSVYYQVTNPENVHSVDVSFDSLDTVQAPHVETSTQSPVGVVTYQEEGNYDHEYEIQVQVRREDDELGVDDIPRTLFADGTFPDEDNPGISVDDSPSFVDLTITDHSGDQAEYEVDYEVAPTERFDHVAVRFVHENGWASDDDSSTDPDDEIGYGPEQADGDSFQIVIVLYEEREGVAIPVEVESVPEDVADGNDP